MTDPTRMLAGFGAKARGHVRLRALRQIAEVEAMLDIRGAAWTPAFEQACDRASLALFGITEKDTRPPEPHPDQTPDPSGSFVRMSDDAYDAYGAALDKWHEWDAVMRRFEQLRDQHGQTRFWTQYQYDVTNGEGEVLRCLPHFERQLYVAHKGLLPGARFTPDGGGRRAAPTAEEWGEALARDAARFRSRA